MLQWHHSTEFSCWVAPFSSSVAAGSCQPLRLYSLSSRLPPAGSDCIVLGFDYCLFIWILEPQPDECMLQWIIQSGQRRNDHPTGTLEFILIAVSVYSYVFKKMLHCIFSLIQIIGIVLEELLMKIYMKSKDKAC